MSQPNPNPGFVRFSFSIDETWPHSGISVCCSHLPAPHLANSAEIACRWGPRLWQNPAGVRCFAFIKALLIRGDHTGASCVAMHAAVAWRLDHCIHCMQWIFNLSGSVHLQSACVALEAARMPACLKTLECCSTHSGCSWLSACSCQTTPVACKAHALCLVRMP